MKFRVPRGFFRGVTVSEEDRERYDELVQSRVNTLIDDETEYRDRVRRNADVLDPDDWSTISNPSRLSDLDIYRRRRRGRSLHELAELEDFDEARRAVETGHPSMIAIGHVDGSIEDMVYGMSATSQADLLTGFSYKDPPRECALLGALDRAASEDPFYSADFIWALPNLSKLVHQVDICYLKATGVGYDREGKRYGYLVLHSVDLAECPPFDKNQYNIVRAKMYFACLFRQYRPGRLYVLVRGIFDLNGAMKIQYMLRAATKSFIEGLFNGVGIGESKKLTLMARRNQAELHDLAQSPMPTTCDVCNKPLSKFRLLGHLKRCRVCGKAICSKCLDADASRRRLFLGPRRGCEEYPCCPSCVKEAKLMAGVRPFDPEYEVLADYYRIQRSRSQSMLQTSSSSNGSPPPVASSNDLDTITQRRQLTTNSSEGMWSTANESTDDDCRFSELTVAAYDFALDGDGDSLDVEYEPEPEMLSGADTSQIVPWEGGGRISVDDDFIPASSHHLPSHPSSAEYQRHQRMMYERLRAAFEVADNTYVQARLNTAAMIRGDPLPNDPRFVHRR